jgi:hypothetical protein
MMRKFSLRLVVMTEHLVKALACTIPFMYGIYEIEFYKNSVTDIMSSVLLFAVFSNPNIKRLSFVGNPVRTSFNKTLRHLV